MKLLTAFRILRSYSSPHFHSVVLAGLCFLPSGAALAGFAPITLSYDSYNADIVVEKGASAPAGAATTASMDGGINNSGSTWYEMGFSSTYPDSGLPHPGGIITSLVDSSRKYQFAPSYKTNDAIIIDSVTFKAATFTFTTPAKYAMLSLLTSGGNGGDGFEYVLHFQDGTTQTGTTNSPDWFNAANYAFSSRGRVNVQNATFDSADDRYSSYNPRLYSKDIIVNNTNSAITSVDINYKSGTGVTCFMALSGQKPAGSTFDPITVSGYNADIVVEQDAGQAGSVADATIATVDNGFENSNNTFYEAGYDPLAPTSGLPAAGTILTNIASSDQRFAMPASYIGTNNCVLIDSGSMATIYFSSPKTYTALSFLCTSGNGNTTNTLVVYHDDGTTETPTFVSPDWFNNNPYAYCANGRIEVQDKVLGYVNSGNPRIYARDVLLTNTTSPVTSIDINSVGGNNSSRCIVFAVSGNSGIVAPIISVQPSDGKIYSTNSATFSVALQNSDGATFQWQKSVSGQFVSLTNGSSISGATSSTLNLSSVTLADDTDYRVVVSNAGGTATSTTAHLYIFSSLTAVTTPGDSISGYGGDPSGANENESFAIDGTTSKYLNKGGNGGSPFKGPAGFVVRPSKGSSVVTGIRFYTANDATERDPADYTLEGSVDGGQTYKTISAGLLSLPDGRNASGLNIDPLTQYVQQVMFSNTASYTTYRLYITNVKSASTSFGFQIGEVEILGTIDKASTNLFPSITANPTSINLMEGDSVTFGITASGKPTPTYQWYRKYNGVTNKVTVASATTDTLTLTTATYADTGEYFCVASNLLGGIPSTPARLTVLSTLDDVTPVNITSFGDFSVNSWGTFTNAANAIDKTTTKYANGGSGPSAGAGFAPFSGPVGLTMTYDSEASVVTVLRIYTADGNTERDPIDYTLAGSADNENFTLISSGSLNLPLDRNAGSNPLDPTSQVLQEIRFANNAAYSSYRVTFNNVRNNDSAACLQFSELQLLGTTATSVSSVLKATVNSDKTITLTCTTSGTLQSTTALKGSATVWTDEGAINGSVTITPNKSTPAKFYRVVSQ